MNAPRVNAALNCIHPRMLHPTTWIRVCSAGVEQAAIDAAVQPLLAPPRSAEVPERVRQQIAIDGKPLCGTIPAGSSQGVHLVSIYDARQQVVLAQMRVGAKANEIAAAPALPLQGVLVLGDAIDAQRRQRLDCQEKPEDGV